MLGLAIEFSLVTAAFLFVWRRQLREQRRRRERAAQLDFDFHSEREKVGGDR